MQKASDTYPSSYESVVEARKLVGRFVEHCGFGNVESADILLAIGEACSNAVEHGHVEQGSFTVSCTFEDALLRIEVSDRGSGFEEQATAERALADVEAHSRGRGITIMRALMDRITYRASKHGTLVALEKHLRGPNQDGSGHSAGSLEETPLESGCIDTSRRS